MAATRSIDRAEAEAAAREYAASVGVGERPATMVLTGGRVVDVYNGRLRTADVALAGERIAAVGDVRDLAGDATEVVDCHGWFVLPGLVEPHLHVGSSQLTIERLAEVLVPRGTVACSTCFYEPGGIAGRAAVETLLERAEGTGLDVLFSPFPAAHLDWPADDRLALVTDERCVELREWGLSTARLPGMRELYVEALRRGRTVGGHLEGLGPRELQASVALGCRSDHETATAEEALARARAGVIVQIREGSGARDLVALVKAITEHGADPACFAFSTDEQELASLADDGHLDHKLRLAVREGLAPLDAVKLATLGAARSMGVEADYGAVAPGRLASLAVVEDLASFRVRRVIARGRLAASDGEYVLARDDRPYPDTWADSVRLAAPLRAEDFLVADGSGRLRVIGVVPGSLLTRELVEHVPLDGGRLAGESDVAKIAIADRHQASGRIGLGLIRGLDVARGAFAATINPGPSNLLVAGVDEEDMALAANRVAELGGGIAVARDGIVRAEVALPLLGLFSHRPVTETIAACRAVATALRDELGCPHDGILTTAGFVGLATAIPHLKLSDRGLVRVERGRAPEAVPLSATPA